MNGRCFTTYAKDVLTKNGSNLIEQDFRNSLSSLSDFSARNLCYLHSPVNSSNDDIFLSTRSISRFCISRASSSTFLAFDILDDTGKQDTVF